MSSSLSVIFANRSGSSAKSARMCRSFVFWWWLLSAFQAGDSVRGLMDRLGYATLAVREMHRNPLNPMRFGRAAGPRAESPVTGERDVARDHDLLEVLRTVDPRRDLASVEHDAE